MNTLKGEIAQITVSNHLSLVKVKTGVTYLFAIVIDTPETTNYLYDGNAVKVIFKETEVIIGKDFEHQVGVLNQIRGSVQSIVHGELLSKVRLDTEIGVVTAVSSTQALDGLGLKTGSDITALIRINDIMLAE